MNYVFHFIAGFSGAHDPHLEFSETHDPHLGFSESHDQHLAQHSKVINFGHRQEPGQASQFYLPDYFSQTEQLKRLNAPEHSSNVDLLQKLNYHGQIQQLSFPNGFQQLPHFNQNQQFNQQAELEKLQTHNKTQELTSSGGHQQLNYHDTHSYSNQLQQNYPSNDQPLNQHGEFETIQNLNQTQLLYNTTGEHQETNYSGMLNHPSQFQHIRYPNQDQQNNQQDEFGNSSQLQLHKSTGEHQQLSYHNALNYLNQLQQQHYRNHYQQQLGNLNQPQFHNSAGEHHHINYHDNPNYPSYFQPVNHSIHDEKVNQQGDLEKQLRNPNQAELHSSSGGHQQLQHNGTLMHPSQFQQFNYPGQDQQHNHQGLPDSSSLTPSNLPHISSGLQQQEHLNLSEKNALPHQGEKSDYSYHLQQLSNPGLFRHFIQPNQHGQDIHPSHQQQTGNSSPVWQHNQPNYPAQIKYSKETGLSNYPKEVQPINYHDNEVIATGLEKNSAYSEPRVQFPSYHHQQEHPHPPVNLVHLNVNEKYGYPDALPQLRSFGEYRQLNQQNNFKQPQHLTEPLQIRYPRDDQQIIYHDLSGTGVPANGPVNSSDNSQPSHVPAGQQQELSEVEKFMKLHNLNPNKNPGDAAVDQSHLSNPGQVPQPKQPDQVVHSEHLTGTQPRSYSIENHHLNSHGNRVPASGPENVPDHSKLVQIPSDLHQKYPDQSEKNTHISGPENSDHSSHQQQFSNLGLLNNPGQQFNRPEQHGQSAHSSFLHHLPNPADFWQPNQPVLFGQYNEPQLRSYSREAQPTNNGDVGVPAAGHENNAAHPELSQIPNHHYQQGYPPNIEEHRDLNVNQNSRYPGHLHQLSNPVQFRQFNPLNILPQFMHSNDPQMHGYLGQSQQPVSRDTRQPDTELEANATYPKILEASNHQQQQGYPDQIENSRDLSPNEKSDSQDPQQLNNPDSIQQLNQSSHSNEPINPTQYQQLNNTGMTQQINQTSHFEDPEHSSQPQQQINSTHDQQLNISGSGIPSSNLEDTAANSNSSGLINPETQEYPDKSENFTPRNLTEQFPQLNNSEPTEKLNSSGDPEQLMQPDEPQVHTNSTDDPQLTYTSQLEHSDSQNENEQLNTSGISHDQNHSSQAEHPVYGSATNLTSNLNQTLNTSVILQMQDNSNQSEHPVYQSATNLTSNQSQILKISGILHGQDNSNQAEHPFYRSATNLTSNQSQLQEHSSSDRPQQNDHPDQVNRSANPEEPQPQINFTTYQQQNHSGFTNDNISASEPEKSATHLQLSQPNYEGLQQERKLENLDHPSQMGYFFRSVRPQRLNPLNQFNEPNHFMQPMSHPQPQVFPPGNQQFNYPGTGPEICYLEKTHGPCLAIIPRYFYDPVDRRCEQFIFGGCEGNANNFVTLEDCETMCMMHLQKGLPANEHIQSKNPEVGYENSALPLWHPGPDLVHEVCSLEKRKGPCRALFHRYFFNTITRSCEPFVYGGCYGNANNFFTKEECEFVCMSL